jgi:hypothetical protein
MTVRNQAGKHMRNQFGGHIRNQKGLATWVKVLIGVMVIGTISIIGIITAGVFFFGSAMKDMMDPQKVKSTVDSIAKFEDPLPAGWKFGMGLNMFGTSVGVVTNENEKLTITLLKLPRGGKEVTSDVIVGEYAEKGIPNISGMDADKTSAPLTVKDKGKLTVGGEEMTFVSGVSERGGKTFSQFIGSLIPKSNPSVIIIQGVCFDSETYKMEQTKKLLSAIKSF